MGLRVRSKLTSGLGVVPCGEKEEDLDLRDKQWWLARCKLSHNAFLKSSCKSQIPQKSVNLVF